MAINPGRAARRERRRAGQAARTADYNRSFDNKLERHIFPRDYFRARHDRQLARRNPSRRTVGVSALSLAALGVFVFAGYQLLQPILHGTAAGANKPAPGAGAGGGPAAPPANPSAGWVALNMTDAGAYPFPLEYMGSRVRQRADLGGTNEYHPGAVFLDGSGNLWKWTGGNSLVGGASGSESASLGDFAA